MMTLDEIVREVRALPIVERKRLISLIVDSLTESEPTLDQKTRSILEFEGVGAEIWQGIATQDYVDNLRNEWDNQV